MHQNQPQMRSHSDILRGHELAAVAARCGVKPAAVKSWLQRNRIPDTYWLPLAEAEMTSLCELASHAAGRGPRRR